MTSLVALISEFYELQKRQIHFFVKCFEKIALMSQEILASIMISRQ